MASNHAFNRFTTWTLYAPFAPLNPSCLHRSELFTPSACRPPHLRPRHRHAHARRSAPCTRARACRAHSTRTLHACEPRHRRTCSHIATRACTSKARMACSCQWPPADCRPARCGHILLAHAQQACSPAPLLARPIHHPHAVHAIHLHRCHPVQRDDDNERDDDERHDEEDQGHDGRRERVRAARACSAHAQRRTRKHAPRESTSRVLATACAAQTTATALAIPRADRLSASLPPAVGSR